MNGAVDSCTVVGRRAERQPAVGVDRQVLELAAKELGFRGDLPERGECRKGGDTGQREQQRGDRDAVMTHIDLSVAPAHDLWIAGLKPRPRDMRLPGLLREARPT